MFTLVCLFALMAGVMNLGGASKTQNMPTLEAPPEVGENGGTLYGTCEMKPSTLLPVGQPEVYGQVLFKQVYPAGQMQIMTNLRGFPTGEHARRGMHIHQFGDLSKGCNSAGPHFNPYGKHHGNHLGDLGNFVSSYGQIRVVVGSDASLFGAHSVLGRSVVLHEGEDDLGRGGDEGSLKSGNAGQKIGCCVIGTSGSSLWEENISTAHRRPPFTELQNNLFSYLQRWYTKNQ